MLASTKTLALLNLLLSAAVAQSITSAPRPSRTEAASSSSRAPETKTVKVGFADHKFEPAILDAEVGDTVRFAFYPKNHSVVRAEYKVPCVPYEMTGQDKVGFYSGFHPVDRIFDDPPTFDILINDTDPIFYYCSALGSCINYQMVGVINVNKNVSFKLHQELAGEAKFMLQPGEPFPEESTQTASPAPGATATDASSATADASSSETPSPSPSKTLSPGAIAGIAIGGAALLLLGAALFFYMGRAKSLKQALHRESATAGTKTAGGGFHDPEMHQNPFPHHQHQGSHRGTAGSEYFSETASRRHTASPGPFDTPPLYSSNLDGGSSVHEVSSNAPGSPRETMGSLATFRGGSPPPARTSRFSEMQKSQPTVVHEMPTQP